MSAERRVPDDMADEVSGLQARPNNDVAAGSLEDPDSDTLVGERIEEGEEDDESRREERP